MPATGYDDDPTLQAGKALFDTAFSLNEKQKQEYGEQYGATDEFDVARRDAYMPYIENVGLARIALKRDRNFLNQLDLAGEREAAYDKAYVQMLQFYDTALASADIQNKLARFNITVDKLNDGEALVDAMQAKHQARLKETSEAQRATHDRDAAMDAIDDWMSDFIGVSRLALKKQPEYLERLGLVDPS